MGKAANKEVMVEAREADPGVYLDRTKETVLPHTTSTGGIEGVDSPYPPITYRKFNKDGSLAKKKELVDIKQLQKPGAKAVPESTISEEMVFKTPPTTALTTQIDTSMMHRIMEKLETMTAVLETPSPRQASILTDDEIAPCVEKPVIKEDPTLAVTFKGAFGEVTAPFLDVIEGAHCIALIQDQGNTFNYTPPIDDVAIINIEWDNNKAKVLNVGLTFKLDLKQKVLVLLAVD